MTIPKEYLLHLSFFCASYLQNVPCWKWWPQNTYSLAEKLAWSHKAMKLIIIMGFSKQNCRGPFRFWHLALAWLLSQYQGSRLNFIKAKGFVLKWRQASRGRQVFTSKRETVSLKLVLLLDNRLQNQIHFILNLGGAVLNHNRRKVWEWWKERERESEIGVNTIAKNNGMVFKFRTQKICVEASKYTKLILELGKQNE